MTRSGFGFGSSANKWELAEARPAPSAPQNCRREIVICISGVCRQFYPSLACFDRIGAMQDPFETNRVEAATVPHLLAITFVFLTSILGMTDCVTANGNDPPFQITTKRDDDKVEVKAEEDKTYFLVQSPFGMGQAIIERSVDNWPTTVMLRLHLKGLE